MARQARVTSSDVVCDLGFGDAQFLLHVAGRTGCRCIGCEVCVLSIPVAS